MELNACPSEKEVLEPKCLGYCRELAVLESLRKCEAAPTAILYAELARV
jgi:hypothetical protein